MSHLSICDIVNFRVDLDKDEDLGFYVEFILTTRENAAISVSLYVPAEFHTSVDLLRGLPFVEIHDVNETDDLDPQLATTSIRMHRNTVPLITHHKIDGVDLIVLGSDDDDGEGGLAWLYSIDKNETPDEAE